MRRTEASRATARGMKEFGKRTVSRRGNTGSSAGISTGFSGSGSNGMTVVGSSVMAGVVVPENEGKKLKRAKKAPACFALSGLLQHGRGPLHPAWRSPFRQRIAAGSTPPAGVSSALHVEEERRRPPALRHHALALLRGLTGLLAVLAADGERERPKPALGDLLTALEAVAERAVLEPVEGFLDLVQGLGLHLDERELYVILDVGLRTFDRIEHALIRIVRALTPDVADFSLHLVHYFAPALFKNPLQFRISVPVHLPPGGFMRFHMNPSFPLSRYVAGRHASHLPV